MTSPLRFRMTGWVTWLSVARGIVPTVTGVVLLLGLIVIGTSFLPISQPQDGTAEESLAQLPTKLSVQRIQPTADGRHVHVYRHMANWQLVEVSTGAIREEQSFPDQFRTGLQVVLIPTPGFVYEGKGGYYWQPINDAESGRILFSTSAAECDAIKASPESEFLACYHGTALQLRSLTSGEISVNTETENNISAIEWSPDGRKLLVLLGEGQLQVRHGRTLEVEQSHRTSLIGGGRIVWASAGNHVAAYSSYGVVMTWDLVSNRSAELTTDVQTLRTLAISSDGESVVVSDAFADVWIYPTEGEQTDRRYVGTVAGTVSALSLVDDDQGLLVGTFEGHLECWTLSTGMQRWTDLTPAPPSINLDTPSEASSGVPCVQRGDSCASTRS